MGETGRPVLSWEPRPPWLSAAGWGLAGQTGGPRGAESGARRALAQTRTPPSSRRPGFLPHWAAAAGRARSLTSCPGLPELSSCPATEGA